MNAARIDALEAAWILPSRASIFTMKKGWFN